MDRIISLPQHDAGFSVSKIRGQAPRFAAWAMPTHPPPGRRIAAVCAYGGTSDPDTAAVRQVVVVSAEQPVPAGLPEQLIEALRAFTGVVPQLGGLRVHEATTSRIDLSSSGCGLEA
jgi:hypothetical protein